LGCFLLSVGDQAALQRRVSIADVSLVLTPSTRVGAIRAVDGDPPDELLAKLDEMAERLGDEPVPSPAETAELEAWLRDWVGQSRPAR
jgi:hypothetical protein